MKILRSIGALVAGYIVFGLFFWLSWVVAGYHNHRDIPPTGFLVASLVFECVLGMGVGLLVGWIAGRRAVLHALILAGFFSLFTAVGLILDQYKGTMWPHLGTLFLVSPAVVLGGYLQSKIREKRE